jgi:hypothetical protein
MCTVFLVLAFSVLHMFSNAVLYAAVGCSSTGKVP